MCCFRSQQQCWNKLSPKSFKPKLKKKKLKLTPEKSLSFAFNGSKRVQIANEDSNVPILEKTPDGRAYIAEPRPHRSKQWKRVIPGIQLLSIR